jgi:hypothetical protein
MVVGVDSILSSSGAVTPPANPIPQLRQVPINPAQDRARSGAERRAKDQGQGNSEFRTTLDSVAATSTPPAPIDPLVEVQSRRAQRQAAAEKNVRGEKRPAQGPAELAADEGERLYAANQAAKKREGVENAAPSDEPALPVQMSTEFYQAASRYAERFFSTAGAYAKPGESLELSA